MALICVSLHGLPFHPDSHAQRFERCKLIYPMILLYDPRPIHSSRLVFQIEECVQITKHAVSDVGHGAVAPREHEL